MSARSATRVVRDVARAVASASPRSTASAGGFFDRTSNATTRAFVATAKLSTFCCQTNVSLGNVCASGTASLSSCSQPRVDEPLFERRDDDHVRRSERAATIADEHDHDADPDPARDDTRYSGLEAVARAADRQDQLGVARIPLDLLAQVADVHVDRARLAVVGARHAAARGARDARTRRPDSDASTHEHLELDERELDRLAANLDRAARDVDPQLASLDHLVALARRDAE